MTRSKNILFFIFSTVLASLIIFVFYRSELRNRTENALYDLRTKLSLSFSHSPKVIVGNISELSIQTLESAQAADLSIYTLDKIIQKIQAQSPRHVIVMLYPQAFRYNDPSLLSLAKTVGASNNVSLGIFGFSKASLTDEIYPGPLLSFGPAIYSADPLSEFRRAIIRTLPLERLNKNQGIPFLLPSVAEKIHPGTISKGLQDTKNKFTDDPERYHYRLNYQNPMSLEHWDAVELVADSDQSAMLKDQIVILGYSAYRAWGASTTFANSPWQKEGGELTEGIPLHWIYAVGLENLLQKRWLRDAPLWLNIIQTLIVCIALIYVWRFEAHIAIALILALWTILILAHSMMFTFMSLFLPLSDTAIFSTITIIVGGLSKIQREARMHAIEEARISTQKQLDSMHGKFLNQFAEYMLKESNQILKIIPPTENRHYLKTKSSVQELQDYIRGMQQLSSINLESLKKQHLKEFQLLPLIQKVISRFDFRIQEKSLTVAVDCPENLSARSDESILEQIIYNLLSNAIKYSPPQKTIRVDVDSTSKQVRIRISDEGPGISEDIQQQVFEKFYRADNDINMQVKGHGLGLYLSRYFAETLSASLTLTSSANAGATFTLSLNKR
jgi:signal transduction histidine kinase